jgi:tRNA-splicing ligase RtcB (3'-phosphate/5'-hydroxy nucleic acid ligase)
MPFQADINQMSGPKPTSWQLCGPGRADLASDLCQPSTFVRAAVSIGANVAAIPDAHPRKGCTIGSVIPMKGAIVPSAVGVGIGCSMGGLDTQLVASDAHRLWG